MININLANANRLEAARGAGRSARPATDYAPDSEGRAAMTPDDIEAAARRVYAVIPVMMQVRVPSTATNVRYTKEWRAEPWDKTDDDYRNYCRRIAAAALNVEETTR